MTDLQRTVSPIDGRIVAERPLATDAEIAAVLARARSAAADWRHVAVSERVRVMSAGVDAFVAHRDAIALEITWQMGRPVAHSPSEIDGFEERARYMASIAEEALSDIVPPVRTGFTRFVRREPLGVVLAIAPWNYPYLTAVNALVPAILAGNSVVLRHSAQTPLCAERLAAAFREAGLPEGVFQIIHCGHEETARMIQGPEVDFVAFTGSVDGGRAVQQAASKRFIGTGLELGGKDPAYVRADADLEHAVLNLVDGAFFNAGQSCCGIERIYVAEACFDAFVSAYGALVASYRLGDPTDPRTSLGPLVRTSAADFVRDQVQEALAAGARGIVEPSHFERDELGTPYLAPQVLVGVTHEMRVMREESFGPVVGIARVSGDEEAIAYMNDSDFGLSASVWTRDEEAAVSIGSRVATGTFFMNRCDYLDPSLAWTGVKDSGRGCTLSRVGYEQLTRPKSFHLRQA